MQDRVLQHSKVSVHLNTLVEDAYADPKGNMGGLMIKNAETGACNTPNAQHLGSRTRVERSSSYSL